MTATARESMIEEAWQLIAERGLSGMSTREVLARTGAPRGSVFHYFPRGRMELIEEAVAYGERGAHQRVEGIDGTTEADVIGGYFGIWRRRLEASDFAVGCSFVGVVTGAHEPELLDRADVAFMDQRDALAAQLRRVGVPAAELEQRATLVLCAAEGAVLLARAQRSIEPLEVVARQLGATLR